jgi:hypothetical protein
MLLLYFKSLVCKDVHLHRHHRYIFEEKEKRVAGAVAAKKPGEKAPGPSKQNVVQARLQVCKVVTVNNFLSQHSTTRKVSKHGLALQLQACKSCP